MARVKKHYQNGEKVEMTCNNRVACANGLQLGGDLRLNRRSGRPGREIGRTGGG